MIIVCMFIYYMGCVYCYVSLCCIFFFFFKQKTAYEMRISDWSSDVCSSDLSELGINVVENEDIDEETEELGSSEDSLSDNTTKDEAEEIGRASCRERVCQYV